MNTSNAIRATRVTAAALLAISLGATAQAIPAGEIEARATEMAKLQMGMFDANKDGKLSLAELQATATTQQERDYVATKFREMDANGDGMVTLQELVNFTKQRVLNTK